MFESNDTFVEQAVKSIETSKHKALKFLCLALTIIFGLFTLMGVFTLITLILFIVFLVLTIILMGNKNIEYEYDYTNGILEIAKIIDNSKRKKLLSIESSEIRMVARVGTNESLKYDNVQLKVYDCSAHNDELKNFVMVAHDEKKNQDYKVIFNPNEKLLNAMKRYNKRDIYEKFRREYESAGIDSTF